MKEMKGNSLLNILNIYDIYRHFITHGLLFLSFVIQMNQYNSVYNSVFSLILKP